MEDFKAYWRQWLWRDTTTRIITVNFLVWLAISAISLFSPNSAHQLVMLLSVPAFPEALPYRFWTVLTYMWLQVDFLHLLCNMLWLLLFAQIVEHGIGPKKTLNLYLLGGLAGACAFMAANAVAMGQHPLMWGASCSVGAIVGAALVLMPRWRVNLLLVGEVQVRWVAIAAIAFFALTESSLYVGIAHAAGLLTGLLLGYAEKRGRFRFVFPSMGKKKPFGRSKGTATAAASDEERLDQLLDIVNRSGYASLSSSQRQELFDLSQRLRQ